MTEAAPEPTDAPPAGEAQPEKPAKPETDWKAEAKKWESRAKENRTAAERLAAIEAEKMTEAEKVAKRISDADAEVASIPAKVADALREHLVGLHEIDKDDAELFLTASDPDLLLKQVTRLLGQSDKRKKNGNIVPREGNNPTSEGSADGAFARELFTPS